jgi:hypothetical protein
VRRKDGSYATGVLHLWHAAADRSRLAENEQRLSRVIESRRARAEAGISSLDPDVSLAITGPGKMGAR